MLKNRKGFTIVEMLVVIGVIALLLLLIIPNIGEKQKIINNKGCEALKETINSQISLYELQHNKKPKNINELVKEGYLKEEQTKCRDNKKITIKDDQAIIE